MCVCVCACVCVYVSRLLSLASTPTLSSLALSARQRRLVSFLLPCAAADHNRQPLCHFTLSFLSLWRAQNKSKRRGWSARGVDSKLALACLAYPGACLRESHLEELQHLSTDDKRQSDEKSDTKERGRESEEKRRHQKQKASVSLSLLSLSSLSPPSLLPLSTFTHAESLDPAQTPHDTAARPLLAVLSTSQHPERGGRVSAPLRLPSSPSSVFFPHRAPLRQVRHGGRAAPCKAHRRNAAAHYRPQQQGAAVRRQALHTRRNGLLLCCSSSCPSFFLDDHSLAAARRLRLMYLTLFPSLSCLSTRLASLLSRTRLHLPASLISLTLNTTLCPQPPSRLLQHQQGQMSAREDASLDDLKRERKPEET